MKVTRWVGHNPDQERLLKSKMFEMRKNLQLAKEELKAARDYSRIARNAVKISLKSVNDAKHNLNELEKEYGATGFGSIEY